MTGLRHITLAATMLLTLLATSGRSAEPKTWQSTLVDRWKVVHISNGLLECGLAPELGGRIVFLRLAPDGHNWPRLEEPEYLRLKPEELSGYYSHLNYGGLFDVHASGWPGIPFTNATYDVTVEKKGGSTYTLTSEATVEGVRSHRVMTILPGTTIFRIDTTMTNTRDQYLDMMYRMNGEYACGPGAFYSVFPANEEGDLIKEKYIRGREKGRGFKKAFGGFVACVDTASATAMLIRYPSEEIDKFLMWTGTTGGENAPSELTRRMPEDYHGFVGINLFGKGAETAPGASKTFYQEHSFVKGFTIVDLVDRDTRTLMQIRPARATVKAGEPIEVQLGAGRPVKGESFPATLRLKDAEGNAVAEASFTFTCPTVGEAEWKSWTVPARDWKDGELVFEVEALGETGAHSFTVATAVLNNLENRIAALEAAAAERAAEGPAGKTEAVMLKTDLAVALQALEDRDLEKATEQVETLEANLLKLSE